MIPSNRREFFLLSGAAGLGLALPKLGAVEPVTRKGEPRLRTSLAAYSFREAFKQPEKFDIFKFIDYCADLHMEGTELTSYYFPTDPGRDYFIKVKRHAFLRGISISGTAVGNNFALAKGEILNQQIAMVKGWIDNAAVMGAPHIRVFAGSAKGLDRAEAVANCIGALEECCDYAGKHGIFLGLENHGGIVAEVAGMLEILKGVKSPWLGVNLDTGNFRTADPYGDLVKVAPYAVNVQLKVEMHDPSGEKKPADIPRLIKMLRDVNYQGFVALEYEEKEDPFKAVPRHAEELRAALAGS